MRKVWIQGIGLAAALAIATPVITEAQGRYTGIDRDRNGVITRAEWPGNDTSFRQHDRNRDGVLTGGEVRSEWKLKADDTNGKNGKKKVKAKPNARSKAKPHKHKGH